MACLRLASKSIVIALGYVKCVFALAENCAFAIALAVVVPLVGQRKLLCRRPEVFSSRGLHAAMPRLLPPARRSASTVVHEPVPKIISELARFE